MPITSVRHRSPDVSPGHADREREAELEEQLKAAQEALEKAQREVARRKLDVEMIEGKLHYLRNPTMEQTTRSL